MGRVALRVGDGCYRNGVRGLGKEISSKNRPVRSADLSDKHHGKACLLHLLRSQLPVTRTCPLSFAATARSRLSSVGPLSERRLLHGADRARSAQSRTAES